MTLGGRVRSIVVADDHPVVLHGLVALLASEADFNVVATCVDGRAALQAIRQHKPELALLDFRMPHLTGLEILAKLTKEGLTTRVALLTASASDSYALAAIRSGAHGIILKEAAAEALITCLRNIGDGKRWVSDDVLQAALGRRSSGINEIMPALRTLTSRERDVLKRVSKGLSNKEIARELQLTEGTVKIHLHNIYEKIGVSNRTSLVALALRLGE